MFASCWDKKFTTIKRLKFNIIKLSAMITNLKFLMKLQRKRLLFQLACV